MQHLRDAVQRGGDRERLVTDEVIASFDGTPDPRTREVLESLVEHLHAFARDVRLTEREWTQAIGFLTRVGHITDDRRQEFILLSDVLGLSMLTVAINVDGRRGRHRVDRLRPVLRRGLARDRDRRRHRRGRQRRAVLGRGPRHRHPRRAARAGPDRGLGGRRRRLLRRPAGRDALRPRAPLHRRRRPLRLLVGQARALPDPLRRPGRRPAQGRPAQPVPAGAHPFHGQPRGP